MHSFEQIRNSRNTSYFLIKSFQADHIAISQANGVWATTVRNEKALSTAFESSQNVVLIFSVNGSGKFNGYAVVTSEPGRCSNQGQLFVGADGRPFLGRPFDIKWINTTEMSFKYFEHINNALNENKPVKVGRDGQPLSIECGQQVLDIFHRHSTETSQYAPQDNVAGAWMINNSTAQQPVDWQSTVLVANPLLAIYPVDLTKFTYNGYLEANLSSVEYLSHEGNHSRPPLEGFVDWSETITDDTLADELITLIQSDENNVQ